MSLLDNFITHFAVEVTRYEAGSISDIDGLWDNGVSSLLNVNMCIQPINQKERLILSESVRDSEIIKVYHGTVLQITNDRTHEKGDTFIYNGNKYTVFSISDWNSGNYDIKYYKSFAVMVDKDNSCVR